eukprot:11248784-Karenia_brevis.AAC.2
MLASLRHHPGIISASFWNDFDNMLASFWHHEGIIPRSKGPWDQNHGDDDDDDEEEEHDRNEDCDNMESLL